MQKTVGRAEAVQISFNIPNEIGKKIQKEPDADKLALKAFEMVYFVLEKNGQTLDQIKKEDFANLFSTHKKSKRLSSFLGAGRKFKRFYDVNEVDDFVRSNRETWKI